MRPDDAAVAPGPALEEQAAELEALWQDVDLAARFVFVERNRVEIAQLMLSDSEPGGED